MSAAGRKILLAVDASDQAEHAFHWYLTSVHRPDNELVLLHVPELMDGDRNRMLYLTANAFDEAVKKEQARVKELEDKYNAKILENGLSGRIRSEGGNKPGEVICKVADEEKVALIVIGTRGLGKVRRTIMGSVSDFVVHHASCPVVVCRGQ
jgi:nucleotide-binding universal stress UspA family protein